MFSGTETVCVYGITMIIMLTVVKNILHFIMETFKKLRVISVLKNALCHEGVWWTGHATPHILNLGTIWR
jgi:hypothetical protein